MTRILVVEDNPVSRAVVARLLSSHGHDVLLAEDGHAALREARRKNPDLILLDLHLPGMDGWDVARRLKDDAPTRGIPIIAITALALNGDREKALEAGCDDYATKPLDVPDLMRRIDGLLAAAGRLTA